MQVRERVDSFVVADEQRTVDMAMQQYRAWTDELLVKAKQEGLTITLHEN